MSIAEIAVASAVLSVCGSLILSEFNSSEFAPVRFRWRKPELGELEADCLRLRNISLQHKVPVSDLRDLLLHIEMRCLEKNLQLHADPAFRNLKTAIAIRESEVTTRDFIGCSERIYSPRKNIYGPFGLRVRPAAGTGNSACVDQLVFQFLSECFGF